MNTQILDLEKKYWAAMEAHDYETVRSLTYFPCIVAGKEGVRRVNEPDFKKMFESGAGHRFKVKSISGAESQVLNENSAIIAYLIDLDFEVDGKTTSGKCACSSTWVRTDQGNWVCALHTESDLKS